MAEPCPRHSAGSPPFRHPEDNTGLLILGRGRAPASFSSNIPRVIISHSGTNDLHRVPSGVAPPFELLPLLNEAEALNASPLSAASLTNPAADTEVFVQNSAQDSPGQALRRGAHASSPIQSKIFLLQFISICHIVISICNMTWTFDVA